METKIELDNTMYAIKNLVVTIVGLLPAAFASILNSVAIIEGISPIIAWSLFSIIFIICILPELSYFLNTKFTEFINNAILSKDNKLDIRDLPKVWIQFTAARCFFMGFISKVLSIYDTSDNILYLCSVLALGITVENVIRTLKENGKQS